MKKLATFFSFIFIGLVFLGKTDIALAYSPKISIEPSIGRPGETISIMGENIRADLAILKLYFLKDGKIVHKVLPSYKSMDGTMLKFEVDPILVTNSRTTNYQVYVANTEEYDYSGFIKSNFVEFGVINQDAPNIVSLSSSQARIGDKITVSGENFKKDYKFSYIEFLLNGKRVALSEPLSRAQSDTSLEFVISSHLVNRFGFGNYQVRVINTSGRDLDNYLVSNPLDIKILDTNIPVLNSINPLKVRVGETVTILGSNFQTGLLTAKIEFLKDNKIVASLFPSYLNLNGAEMRFVIDQKLFSKTGFGNFQVRVVNMEGDESNPAYSDSVNLGIIDTPQASSIFTISPNEGKIGDKITIFGPYFDQHSFVEIDNSIVKPIFRTKNSISFRVTPNLKQGTHKIQVGQHNDTFLRSEVFYFNVLEGKSENIFVDGCIDLSKNLRRGNEDKQKNGDIFKLQSFLYLMGYLKATPNGYFGFGTEGAVESFQQENEIRITGEAGPLTRAKIKEMSCGLW